MINTDCLGNDKHASYSHLLFEKYLSLVSTLFIFLEPENDFSNSPLKKVTMVIIH